MSKSVCSCPGTSGWLLFSQCQESLRAFLPHGALKEAGCCELLDDLLLCDGRLWDGRGLLCHGRNGSRQQLVLL